jgi:prophage DNA circulation protein
MSKLNLNHPADFATATMSNTTELLAAFARDKAHWSIAEGTYKGGRKTARQIHFLVFKSKQDYQASVSAITDSGGRRTAKILFPYVDGQTTDDMGRRGEDFDLEIMFHGPTYKVGLNRLMIEFNDPIPGTLEHPVRGTIRAKAQDWQIVHSHDAKNAAMVRVKFTEHNFDTAAFADIMVIKTVKSALQKVIAALQKIGATIAAVRQIVGVLQGAVVALRQKMQEFYTAYQTLAVDAASAFGLASTDIAAILPINQGGNVAPAAGGRTAGGVNSGADPATFGGDASTAGTAGTAGLATTTGGFIRVSNRFVTIVQAADPFANLPLDLLGDVARQAIEQTQLKRRIETLRLQVDEMANDIDTLINQLPGVALASVGRASSAAQTLVAAKVTLLQSCDAMSATLLAGQANGRPQIINYTVPHTMSIREAAFRNGLKPQDGADIALLNPSLESANFIEKGSTVLVPTFT